MTKKEKIQLAIKIALIVILVFGLLFYSLLPELSGFRNSIYGFIIQNLTFVGLITYLSLSKKINIPIIGKITIWIFVLIYVLFGIIDIGRIEALFFFVYSIFNVLVSIYIYKKTGTGYKSVWGFGAFAYLTTVIFCLRVEYINGEMNPTFLYTSIIFTAIIFVPCLIYGLTMFTVNRDYEKLICIPLLGLLGGFALTWLTISSMNVYLDTSEPTYEEYIIIDKDVRTGARQITTYELEVQKDDITFTIAVSEIVYYDYEINDLIELSIYSGAFNEPYIIHDNNKN